LCKLGKGEVVSDDLTSSSPSHLTLPPHAATHRIPHLAHSPAPSLFYRAMRVMWWPVGARLRRRGSKGDGTTWHRCSLPTPQWWSEGVHTTAPASAHPSYLHTPHPGTVPTYHCTRVARACRHRPPPTCAHPCCSRLPYPHTTVSTPPSPAHAPRRAPAAPAPTHPYPHACACAPGGVRRPPLVFDASGGGGGYLWRCG